MFKYTNWKDRAIKAERQLALERTLREQAESARDQYSGLCDRQLEVIAVYDRQNTELLRTLRGIEDKLRRYIASYQGKMIFNENH